MTVVWVIIGIVLLLVIWALVSAYSGGKSQVNVEPMAQTPMPFDTPEKELPKVKHWSETATAGVSKNFGRGGAPTGISRDIGKANSNVDEEMERLKKAKPFEPRITASGMRPDET
jgi:hypothetical protein